MNTSDTESKATISPKPNYCDINADGYGIPKFSPAIRDNKMLDETESTKISSVQSTHGMKMEENVSEESSEDEYDGNISGVVIEFELESELPTDFLSKDPDFFVTREPAATLIEIQDSKVKDQKFSVSKNSSTRPDTSSISSKPYNHVIGTEQMKMDKFSKKSTEDENKDKKIKLLTKEKNHLKRTIDSLIADIRFVADEFDEQKNLKRLRSTPKRTRSKRSRPFKKRSRSDRVRSKKN